MYRNLKYLILLFSISISLQADIAENIYTSFISKTLFTSNNKQFKTGWYKFDKQNSQELKLNNSDFVGHHYFSDKNATYRPFIQGGFGFSKIEQDNINLGRDGSLDDIEFDSIYYKIGIGCNFNPYKNVVFVVGASAMLLNSDDGNFHPQTPLSNSSYDQKINKLFNQESNSRIYDVYSSIIYHPTIYSYKTRFNATLHYIDMEYDHDVENIDGFNLDLRAAIHTHELTTWMDLPVWMEFYVSAVFLDEGLSDVVGFDSAITSGISLHWKVGPMIHLFDDAFKDVDLSANIQSTFSNTAYQGWKINLSFQILKF
jgi:hypothetical protein